ncbi:hypothetical protein GCM10009799_40240 [Nocardiopsis rhodophaea]|uniref:Uncharacterized protein n=1 Tax=Nocardiopsis rhodophaea TaxID=280238 RepID=A0ABN2TG96_9ACTN
MTEEKRESPRAKACPGGGRAISTPPQEDHGDAHALLFGVYATAPVVCPLALRHVPGLIDTCQQKVTHSVPPVEASLRKTVCLCLESSEEFPPSSRSWQC